MRLRKSVNIGASQMDTSISKFHDIQLGSNLDSIPSFTIFFTTFAIYS
jgi:hypothetical protein